MYGYPRISRVHVKCPLHYRFTPESWIESYEMVMEMLDVGDTTCAKYFTMMLEGTTRTWLKNLPANSIGSWADLRARFIQNFKDTCKQPMSIVDLAASI